LSPVIAFNYYGVGVAYDFLGDYSTATDWYNKALALQPDLRSALISLAYVSLRQGDYQQCIERAEKILATDPTYIDAVVAIGSAEVLQGNYQRAEKYLARSVAIDSLQGDNTGLGYVYWNTGRYDEARKMFARSLAVHRMQLEQGNEYSFVPYDLAVITAIQGNKAEAYTWLQKAIDAGWREYRAAERDPSLENLRGDDRFKNMMADVRAKVDEMRKRVEEMDKAESR
jgi:tetratricopeptide (TPR) repeat protein